MKDAADHSSIVCAILAAHVRGRRGAMRAQWSSLSQNKFRRIFSAAFDGRESPTDSNLN
jgi:hypothetical protein